MVSMFLFSVHHFTVLRHRIQCSNSLAFGNLFFSLHTELLLPITLFYIYGNFISFLCKTVPVLVNSVWLLDFVFFSLFYVSNYAKYFKIVSFKVFYYFKYLSWMLALFPITYENSFIHVVCNYFLLSSELLRVLSFLGVPWAFGYESVSVETASYFNQINISFHSLIPGFVNFSVIFFSQFIVYIYNPHPHAAFGCVFLPEF